MSVSDLTPRTQDYLKVIWGLQEWSDTPVTATRIAERIGLRVPTVSEAVRKLADQGLVKHARYGDVELTPTGRTHALSMVRRHRLLETFLVNTLGYGWDEVHAEAEILEHAVSDDLIARIDTFLGKPTRDPHGDPIPTVDGVLVMPEVLTLHDAAPGQKLRVERVSDSDADLLRALGAQGIVVGAEVHVLAREPDAESVPLRVQGRTNTLNLGAAAEAALRFSQLDETP